VVEATLRLKPESEARKLKPVLIFNTETGSGRLVDWENLEAVKGCRVQGDRLLIPPDTREAKFRGVSNSDSHPVPAADSTITIDVREVELVGGKGVEK
jgi:hypothetical protein